MFILTLCYFSVKKWIQSESFDVALLPMGELAHHLGIRPCTEYTIQGDGLICRESLTINLVVRHPFNVLNKSSSWSLLYEILYQVDPTKDFLQVLSVARDPLAFLGELLLRHDDALLDHRVCLACKYPM